MLKHVLALLAPMAVLTAVQNDNCEIRGRKAICNTFDIRPTKSGEFEDIAEVQIISASGGLDNNTLQFFPVVTQLEIFNSNISNVSLGSDISVLNVSNSIFPKVTNDMLKGAIMLKRLLFISNPGLTFEDGAFRSFGLDWNLALGLDELTIANQSLPRVRRRLFEGLKRLMCLRLISDGIRDVDEDAFQGLVSLYGLYLDNNPIESLHVNFSRMPGFRFLSLFGTNLKRIDFGVLSTATYLNVISFPVKALRHMDVTELVVNMPDIRVVGVMQYHVSCRQVAPVLEDMKRAGIHIREVTLHELLYLSKFYHPLTC